MVRSKTHQLTVNNLIFKPLQLAFIFIVCALKLLFCSPIVYAPKAGYRLKLTQSGKLV